MAVTYNAGTNKISVAGYSLVTPCTFLDIWNADKAGTYSLHDRNGINAVDGAAVAVTNALRPTDCAILGGASGDLYITITNWNLMTNATIRVTGTDRDGNAQTDDIVVNANGNFNTAKWFKTVTHTQVTVFNTPGGGSFDYELIQGQWGIFWKLGSAQFASEAQIIISNGAWFADEEKHIAFWDTIDVVSPRLFEVYGNFRFGVLESAVTKAVSKGCALLNLLSERAYIFYGRSGSLIELYDSLFVVSSAVSETRKLYLRGTTKIYHVVFSDIHISDSTGVDIYELYVTNASFGIRSTTGTLDTLKIEKCLRAVYAQNLETMTLTNAVVRDNIQFDFYFHGISANDSNCIDVTSDWTFIWGGICTKVLNRKYTFNLRVVDGYGTGISGATVTMHDKNGLQSFSVATDASGDIAEQTVLYGYYDQAHGSTIEPDGVGYSPHTVTISKAGYAPRIIVYTMDRAREEIEKLGGGAPHGREYRRRRVPGEVSVMDEYE